MASSSLRRAGEPAGCSVLDLGAAVDAVVKVCAMVGRLDRDDIRASQAFLPLTPNDAGRLFIAAGDVTDERGAPLLYDLVKLLDARARRARGEPLADFADTQTAGLLGV